ncbi:MAG: glycosyltransferase [Planctomycetota bacterium]
MANISLLCTDAAGHLFPLCSLGQELRRRGHQIQIVSREPARALCERFGFPLQTLPPAEPIQSRISIIDGLASVTRLRQPLNFLRRNIQRIEATFSAGPALLKQTSPDLILSDQLTVTAGTIAEHLQIPHVSVSESLFWHWESRLPPFYSHHGYANSNGSRLRNNVSQQLWTVYMRPWLARINHQRRIWKLPTITTIEQLFSPLAHLVQLTPDLDFPRQQLPSTVHYVGALSSQRMADLLGPKIADSHRDRANSALVSALDHLRAEAEKSATKLAQQTKLVPQIKPAPQAKLTPQACSSGASFPWEQLDGRPLIYASVGNVYKPKNPAVLRTIAAACAPLNVQLVLTKGQWKEDDCDPRGLLRDLPGQPLLVEFAPQLELLQHARLLVTHAGMNTVLEALSLGVPMVALPCNADQPGIAARVEHAGVGLRSSYHRPNVTQLRQQIERVLSESQFRERAVRLQRSLWQAGGVHRAADLVEQVLKTGQPVLRETTSTDRRRVVEGS